ncbi:MAG: hypothetical protein JNM69_35840 [Archangium sp.]|nr:hypothetical protein [Archangium sp.]
MKATWLVLLLAACEGTIVGSRPVPESVDPNPSGPTVTHVDGPQYATAKCEGVGMARTFRGLDGQVLEAGRTDAAFDLDRRQTRTWETTAAWGADMNQKLGYYLASDGLAPTALVPVRSRGGAEYAYTSPPMGALELYSQFRLGFLMCSRLLKSPPVGQLERTAFVIDPKNAQPFADFLAVPTPESGARRCESMMRRFWKLVPSAEQVAACADFAVNETAAFATTPQERWAYVCAALLTSSGAITQ